MSFWPTHRLATGFISLSLRLSLSFSALARKGGNWALLSLDSDRVRSVQHWFLQIAMKPTFYRRTHSAVSHILMLYKYELIWIINGVSEDTMHCWKKSHSAAILKIYKGEICRGDECAERGQLITRQCDSILLKLEKRLKNTLSF